MRKLVTSQSTKAGQSPGTLVFLGEEHAEVVNIRVLEYDHTTCVERRVDSIDDALASLNRGTITWINIDGLQDTSIVRTLADRIDLHPLVQEDILNTAQRPKYEDHEGYLFVVLKMLLWDCKRGEVAPQQVSLLVGEGYVVSFHEKADDQFDSIRQRIRSGKGRIRKMSACYLGYRLIDTIVDGYYGVLEHMGDQIETIESALVNNPTPETLRKLYRIKRENLLLRKSIWPLRDMISGLNRSESQLITEETRVYFRDVYDHSIQVLDTIETFRDVLGGLFDTYLSSVSNRMNEIMKVLTIIATIFIPLTFIAGVYGMNFKHMPELDQRWAYPMTLALMAAVAIGMVVYFRRKKWL